MSTTKADLMAQIQALESTTAELRKQAEEKRKDELAEVIVAVSIKIAEYGISAKDLDLDKTTSAKRRKTTRTPASQEGAVQYKGPSGEQWSSKTRGRKPRWVTEALARGKSLDDFRV